MASKEEYLETLRAADAARKAALYAKHSTPPPPPAPVAARGKKASKAGDIVAFPGCEVPSVEILIDAPVQPDLFGEDLETSRHRVECQGTGKRGKHFGVRHES